MAAENKTKATKVSVDAFLKKVPNAKRRADGIAVAALMSEVTKEPAKMWGPSIVGFGTYHYKYESGREGDICAVGFSPRAAALTLYVGSDFPGGEALVQKLGKLTKSKGCLYVKNLDDIDLAVLKTLVGKAYKARMGKAK